MNVERVLVHLKEVDAHYLAHGQGVIHAVGVEPECRALRNARRVVLDRAVRNAVVERIHIKYQIFCRLLPAQVDEVCPKHEANTGSADVQIVGSQVRRPPVTARPVDFEHGQIALRGGTPVNGTDVQQRAVDGTTRKRLIRRNT